MHIQVGRPFVLFDGPISKALEKHMKGLISQAGTILGKIFIAFTSILLYIDTKIRELLKVP